MSSVPAFNFPAFDAAAKHLRGIGYDVLSAHEIPHTDGGQPGSIPWTQYLREDIVELLTCDAIALLPGWPESRGARLELSIALQLEMPVWFYDAARPERLVRMSQERAA